MPRLANTAIRAAARRANSMRHTFAGGRPKSLRHCKTCNAILGAREMRQHTCPGPSCPGPSPQKT